MGGGLESGFHPETRKLIKSDFSIKEKEVPLQTSYYSSTWVSGNCVWTVKQQVRELVIVGKEMFGPWPTPDPLLSWVEPKTAASMPPVTGLHSTYTDTQTCFKVHKDPHKWCLACKTTLMIIWVEQQVQVQTSHLFCSWTWHSAPL